ncbi:hypothetical protein FKM82_011305 [Ascaphus truei]
MLQNTMAQLSTARNGGPNMWAITTEERAKHDKQFACLKPVAGLITGDQARSFFLQSGLPPSVLAEIWSLSDLNKDGKMDQQEFSIAMKFIKLRLQGQSLPLVLPPVMTQPPVFSPLMSSRYGTTRLLRIRSCCKLGSAASLRGSFTKVWKGQRQALTAIHLHGIERPFGCVHL